MRPPFSWLPVGHELPGGTLIGCMESFGKGYQIIRSKIVGEIVLLIEENTKAEEWLTVCANESIIRQEFLGRKIATVVLLEEDKPVKVGDIPNRLEHLTYSEATELLSSLIDMEENYPSALWSEAIFIRKLSICLPVAEGNKEDRITLAYRLLTGGVEDITLSPKKVINFNRWLTEKEIQEFLKGFGAKTSQQIEHRQLKKEKEIFELPGQPDLERFFREYVIEQYKQRERYATMGVEPPNAILLYGPPGTGKTFSVKMLANYLGWTVFELGIGEIGSPYIHQTSIQINEVFNKAIKEAPSFIIIDEVDALTGDRDINTQDYKIEEKSEFLKLLEAAAENGIIIVGTTNRKEAIDEAFLRKGRFDHVFEVGYPKKEEVLSVLESLISKRPHVPGLGLSTAAEKLADRPMSDVAWVVNEAARLAVKSMKEEIDDICLFSAISKIK